MTLECEVKERDKHDKVPDVQRAGGRIDAQIDGALVIQQMLSDGTTDGQDGISVKNDWARENRARDG